MSVINRVLSQLERRGVRIESDLEMVRAVSPRRSGRRLPLLLGLLALATWWWLGGIARDPEPSMLVAASRPPAAIANRPQSDAVATVVAAASSGVPVASVVTPVVPVQPAQKPELQTPKPAPLPALKSAQPPVPPKPTPQPAPLPKVMANIPPKPSALATPEKVKPGAALPAAQRTVASAPSKSATQPKVASKPPAAAPATNKAAPPKLHQDKPTAAAPAVETGGMPMKQVSRAQQADTEFRRGQQGRGDEAIASYQTALQLDAAHDGARQALVALLLEGKRNEEAERLLQERLENRPEHTGFAMLLARLQVERAATGEALVTLERSLPHAGTRPDYLAFLAALQQRNNLHAEAAGHYQAALQLQPDNGAWLMGYGISLQALRRTEDARAAYQKALESKTLNPELKVFIQRKLKGL